MLPHVYKQALGVWHLVAEKGTRYLEISSPQRPHLEYLGESHCFCNHPDLVDKLDLIQKDEEHYKLLIKWA